MEKAIECIGLSKKKGNKTILHEVSFEVYKGEIVGFLGANGSGKTSTMKCIAGLYEFDGEIRIMGKDAKKERSKCNGQIASLIEEPCFYPNLSGLKNLKINAAYFPGVTDKVISGIVDTLHMKGYIDRKVKTYSLGMKQRIGLAMAMLNDPDVIMLDEPMNGLDPAGIMDLRNMLIKLAHEQNKAVFISSHILTEMQMLCDRVVFLSEGRTMGTEKVGEDLEKQYMDVMKGEAKAC
ncbi:MAG: ATP-binding cassette domain-containing protein [Lachnospiraceae bacterium]|nr:ATP-binding cassette domain-containing protein [Lachnospiraceae bacterium]